MKLTLRMMLLMMIMTIMMIKMIMMIMMIIMIMIIIIMIIIMISSVVRPAATEVFLFSLHVHLVHGLLRSHFCLHLSSPRSDMIAL